MHSGHTKEAATRGISLLLDTNTDQAHLVLPHVRINQSSGCGYSRGAVRNGGCCPLGHVSPYILFLSAAQGLRDTAIRPQAE